MGVEPQCGNMYHMGFQSIRRLLQAKNGILIFDSALCTRVGRRMQSMVERVTVVSEQLAVIAVPGAGTTIRTVFPLIALPAEHEEDPVA